MKIYKRDDYMRNIEKQGYFSNTFKGVDDAITFMTCRFCGAKMVRYRDIGNSVVWCCETPECPNNPNYRMRDDLTTVFQNTVGNTERLFAPWIPKRLI